MEFRPRPFDVETTFASIVTAKKKRMQRYRGPDAPLYSLIWPMVYIVRIFGLAPYKFSNERLVPSNLCLVFSSVTLVYYTYVIYIVYLRFTGLKRERPVLGGTETMKVIFNYGVLVYDILFTAFTRSTFVQIWNAFQDFDESMRQLGYPPGERKTGFLAWILLITQTIIWTSVNYSGMFAFLETWLYNVGYMSLYVGSSVSVYKFVGMSLLLGQRFERLNEVAKRNLPPRKGPATYASIGKETVQNLHDELLIAGETLDSLYSWSLFLWLGNLSMHSVSNLYFVIDWIILTSWSSIAWPLISCLCIWLTAYLSQLVMLNYACDYTTEQANSMGAILTDWNARLLSKDPRNEIVDTSLHLINRKLSFSAAGCFPVNLQLLCSMAGILTTYLVILLQLPD